MSHEQRCLSYTPHPHSMALKQWEITNPPYNLEIIQKWLDKPRAPPFQGSPVSLLKLPAQERSQLRPPVPASEETLPSAHASRVSARRRMGFGHRPHCQGSRGSHALLSTGSFTWRNHTQQKAKITGAACSCFFSSSFGCLSDKLGPASPSGCRLPGRNKFQRSQT